MYHNVDQDVSEIDGLNVLDIPEVRSAVVAPHYGSESKSSTWNIIENFVESKGMKSAGIYREVYLISKPNPSNLWITELQLPLIE